MPCSCHESSIEEVKDFATRADAAEFIDHLPEGYDTIIGERGVGLSGGQRQRIALARAMAVKPGILVMDDTTSAVDSETEQYILPMIDHVKHTWEEYYDAVYLLNYQIRSLLETQKRLL